MPFQLTPEDPLYPGLLKEIRYPPACLWGDGDAGILSHQNCIAIVGSRECTSYGQQAAFELARDLTAAGMLVVSGFAYGIDTAAHKGALKAGGKTIAVLGCGIDVPYLSRNQDLRSEIRKNGVLISEFAPGTEAAPWTFPQRNRIISGVSRGVVVVEAAEKSGSLITAEFALQQGREVFAVPGSLHSPLSRGTHRLIQNGAKLIMTLEDILEKFQVLPLKTVTGISEARGTEEEKKLLSCLSEGASNMDDLIEASGYSIEKVSSLLIEMELGGRIRSLPGSRYEIARSGK